MENKDEDEDISFPVINIIPMVLFIIWLILLVVLV